MLIMTVTTVVTTATTIAVGGVTTALFFRRRAVELVGQGKRITYVASLLGIGRITLQRWLKMKELAPPKMGPKTNFYKLCPVTVAQAQA
jgi:hypothetical protein